MLFEPELVRVRNEANVLDSRSVDDKAVFIVDDDPAIRHSLQRLLRAHGFHPETFDSAEAFSASENTDGLCLVLDINLSGRSGIELGHQLAASGCSLPIIFITGNDTERVRKDALDMGCIDYLRKPFSAQSLLDAINRTAAFRKSRSA
jgi:FixJ family two-component response regulator